MTDATDSGVLAAERDYPLEKRTREFFDEWCDKSGQAEHRPLVGAAFSMPENETAELAMVRQFQAALFDAGFAWVRGPTEFGGGGLDDERARVVESVAREFAMPDTNALLVGLRIVAPAINRYGTTEQKLRWLPSLYRGDSIACQLFSEPDAGSDLASLRTVASRTSGGWMITGQKVWSSGAHLSDVGELLARTGNDPAQRHRGLSMFLVDMGAPGVTVNPIRQMNGSAHFCEVFLDEVFVADDCMLDQEGNGWGVAQVSLSSERDGFGDDDGALFIELPRRVIELGAATGRNRDPVLRQRISDLWARDFIGHLLAERAEHESVAAATRGVWPSLAKLFATATNWEAAQVASTLLGPDLVAGGGLGDQWTQVVLGVPAPRIAGGTDEIQRNIVAERGLGLPREPRVRPE